MVVCHLPGIHCCFGLELLVVEEGFVHRILTTLTLFLLHNFLRLAVHQAFGFQYLRWALFQVCSKQVFCLRLLLWYVISFSLTPFLYLIACASSLSITSVLCRSSAMRKISSANLRLPIKHFSVNIYTSLISVEFF